MEGLCSCVCEDENWSDRNILGRASCIPHVAHKIFGSIGLGISVGVLYHAAYQLRRQNKFHEQQLVGSCNPVELCRWHLHIYTLVAASISILYFILVLADVLRWCAAVGALVTAPAYIGGSLLAARMWVYTNDPRLLRESPRVSALSHWLERRLGNAIACCIVAIVPGVAVVLALADFTEMAARIVALGGVVIGVGTVVTFVIFGRALLKAINKSMKHHKDQALTTAGVVQGAKEGDHTLLEAKRKVKIVVAVDVVLVSSGSLITLLAVTTGFDMEVPLVMFGVTFAYVPLIWLAFNIQVHSGRSGSHRQMMVGSPMSSRMASRRPSLRRMLFSSSKQREKFSRPTVIPTEVPC